MRDINVSPSFEKGKGGQLLLFKYLSIFVTLRKVYSPEIVITLRKGFYNIPGQNSNLSTRFDRQPFLMGLTYKVVFSKRSVQISRKHMNV